MTGTLIDLSPKIDAAKAEHKARDKDARMLVGLAADVRAGRVTIHSVGGEPLDGERFGLMLVLSGTPTTFN